MLKLTKPGLRRSNVVLDSLGGCVANATEEFSRAPEMSVSEMPSEPGMFFEKFKGTIAFKQLKSQANTHGRRHLNKQVDVINSDVEFVNFKSPLVSDLPEKEFAIHFQPVKFERVFCVFNFPHEVESVLPEAMLPGFQIHFLSPEHSSNYVHQFISEGLVSRPSDTNHLEILNFEDGDSSQNLKVWVSSPWM